MTLREEILRSSGLLNEGVVNDHAFSALKNFRNTLNNHELAYEFESKAVYAMENGEEDNIPVFIQEAKLYMKYLDGLVEMIDEEKKLINTKIDEIKGR